MVLRGDSLLATMQPRDPELLDARELASSEARVKAQEAALQRAQPVLESARVALEFAESELGRAREIAREKGISDQELDRAESNYRLRSEEFRAAKFSERITEFELELARAALLRTNPENEGKENNHQFEIHSPINGRVLRVLQESATVVTAGAQLLELGDPSDLEIEVDVLSSDAVKIQPGARVLLEQWGGDQPLEGVVRLVEPSAFTKVSALGVEEQRVNIIVDFVDPPDMRETLGDGFRVEARIVIWEAADVLKIPMSALFRIDEQWAVFVVKGDRARIRRVVIGQQNGLEAQVLTGLEFSEQAVLHPSDKLGDGSKVAPRSDS
jgi:HlyD family secretion protein